MPALEEGVERRERHREGADDNVVDGEAGDENVDGRAHGLASADNKHHQTIATNAADDDDDVKRAYQGFDEGIMDNVPLDNCCLRGVRYGELVLKIQRALIG